MKKNVAFSIVAGLFMIAMLILMVVPLAFVIADSWVRGGVVE